MGWGAGWVLLPRLPEAEEEEAEAEKVEAAAAAAAARGLSRGGADALVLGNCRIKLESSRITQRSARGGGGPGDPGDSPPRNSPETPRPRAGQLRARGPATPLPARPRPRRANSGAALRFVSSLSPTARGGGGGAALRADGASRTYIQTSPDTAGSKRIKEI